MENNDSRVHKISKFILTQMEEGDKQSAWPKDMESRRIADLEKFLRNNPSYKFEFAHLQVPNENRNGGDKGRLSSITPISRLEKKRGRPKNVKSTFWSLEATLELLDAIKAFVRTNNLCTMGIGIEKWKSIAIQMSNLPGGELTKHTRRCQGRFELIRRLFRTDTSRLEIEVQHALTDYFEICELNVARTSRRRAPSPSPAIGTLCLDHKSLEIREPPYKREGHERQLSDPCIGSYDDSTGSAVGF